MLDFFRFDSGLYPPCPQRSGGWTVGAAFTRSSGPAAVLRVHLRGWFDLSIPDDGDGNEEADAVLVVDQVEPCAAFPTGALGFARTAEVTHDGETGFVMLQKGAVEIMHQSRASVAADLRSLTEGAHRTVSTSKSATWTPSRPPSPAPRSCSPAAPPSTG
jgi:hypothetical protein